MDISVPVRSSVWSGTGTVIVELSMRFCIMTWLPRLRTSTNPSRERITQTWRPDRTRSLPNLDLKTRNENFGAAAAFYLARICRLKKKFDRLLKVVAGRFDRIALAGYIEFRAQSDIAIAFALNDRGELLCVLHTPPQPSF